MKPLRLQCSSLAQMKAHYNHLFRGENVTSSPSFTSGGGLHRRTTIAYWMKESTLECCRLNLSLHTWWKVIDSTRVRTQHCTFSRDKMVHLRHWSTIVQDLKNLRTPLSPSQPHTSLPSPNWLQQWTNHLSTLSYLVTRITSTQCREQAPGQSSLVSQEDQNLQTSINFQSKREKEMILPNLSLIHIWRCRRIERCRSRWSPYH